MDAEQFKSSKEDLESIKRLLALQLKNSGASINAIDKAMGISKGELVN